MQRFLAVLAAVVMSTALLGAAPAQAAANPQTDFYLSGLGKSATGNLIWYNRSVRVGGTLFSNSGCGLVRYQAETSSGRLLSSRSRTVCNDTLGHGFTLDADVAGGADVVYIYLYSGGTLADSTYLTRNS